MTETVLGHLSRRISVITERMELELNVAGTTDADLERSVFKATKNNTKPCKQKHVDKIMRTINEPTSAKNCLRMLARRLREGDKAVTAVKTLIVWHRCLRTGDSSFASLCAMYKAVLAIPNFADRGNPELSAMAVHYTNYLREKLTCFSTTEYEYEKESEWDKSKISTLDLSKMVNHSAALTRLMKKMALCQAPGSYRQRNVVQAWELLFLDLAAIARALNAGIEALLDKIGEMNGEQVAFFAEVYEKHAAVIDSIRSFFSSHKEVPFETAAANPLKAIDKSLKSLVSRLSSDELNVKAVVAQCKEMAESKKKGGAAAKTKKEGEGKSAKSKDSESSSEAAAKQKPERKAPTPAPAPPIPDLISGLDDFSSPPPPSLPTPAAAAAAAAAAPPPASSLEDLLFGDHPPQPVKPALLPVGGGNNNNNNINSAKGVDDLFGKVTPQAMAPLVPEKTGGSESNSKATPMQPQVGVNSNPFPNLAGGGGMGMGMGGMGGGGMMMGGNGMMMGGNGMMMGGMGGNGMMMGGNGMGMGMGMGGMGMGMGGGMGGGMGMGGNGMMMGNPGMMMGGNMMQGNMMMGGGGMGMMNQQQQQQNAGFAKSPFG